MGKRLWGLGVVKGVLLVLSLCAALGSSEPVVATPRALTSTLAFAAVDRDAIGRVAFAEAADQGDSGLAAVVFTLLNRLADGRWGYTAQAVVNAPHQFEPVSRAGGDWRLLKPLTLAQQARIDTILNLALDGRLPDLTRGANYFQNPILVAARAARGEVAGREVDFGGAAPSATIGQHRFYTHVASSPDGRHLLSPTHAHGGALHELSLNGGVGRTGYLRLQNLTSHFATGAATSSLPGVIWITHFHRGGQ